MSPDFLAAMNAAIAVRLSLIHVLNDADTKSALLTERARVSALFAYAVVRATERIGQTGWKIGEARLITTDRAMRDARRAIRAQGVRDHMEATIAMLLGASSKDRHYVAYSEGPCVGFIDAASWVWSVPHDNSAGYLLMCAENPPHGEVATVRQDKQPLPRLMLEYISVMPTSTPPNRLVNAAGRRYVEKALAALPLPEVELAGQPPSQEPPPASE